MTNSAWIEANGISLRYALSGRGEELIVLVHEMGGAIESFDEVARRLEKRYRVLRYDLRNCGLSERSVEAVTIEQLVADLAALLDQLKIDSPIALAGSAMGAGVALAFAAAHKDRTAALVMMSPATGLPHERKAAAIERAADVERYGVRPTTDSRLMTSFPPAMRSDGARFENVRLRRLATDPFAISAYTRLLAAMDLDAAMAGVACPTLVLAGRHDLDRPPATVDVATAAIRNRHFNILESGHFMSLQAPDLVSGEIELFLSGIDFLRSKSAS
jgi:3-oxoadipate enol-lactonase